MSLIIVPAGFGSELRRETLSREEIKLVTEFEAWCRKRNLALDLICRDCVDAGHGAASRCKGDNGRDATVFKITCAHCERVYGDTAVVAH